MGFLSLKHFLGRFVLVSCGKLSMHVEMAAIQNSCANSVFCGGSLLTAAYPTKNANERLQLCKFRIASSREVSGRGRL